MSVYSNLYIDRLQYTRMNIIYIINFKTLIIVTHLYATHSESWVPQARLHNFLRKCDSPELCS
jgi:hypothetical protein